MSPSNEVELTLHELRGVICWDAHWDADLNLSISFGQPSLSIIEPHESQTGEKTVDELFRNRLVTIRGEWVLWIWHAYWTLSIPSFGVVTIASPYKRKHMGLARLDGQKLVQASVNPITAATQLGFDLGASLAIRRRRARSDAEMWSLSKPTGYTIVRADGTYSTDPGHTEPDMLVWKPIAAA